MRIIAGEFRSRRLLTPKDDATTRPIPDRAKESLFGLLRGHCEGATVFDGFAGTGALGLEALSRGAERCVFVEKDKQAAEMLRQNIEMLGVQGRSELIIGDALGAGAMARAPRPLTLAFLDPPYPLIRDPIGWSRVKGQLAQLIALLVPDGFAVVRTPWPYFHEIASEGPAPASPRRKPKKKKKGEPRWSFEKAEWERWAKPAAMAHEREAPEDTADEPGEAAPPPQHLDADMSIEGATGPETHVYHSTAVHLYGRAPAAGA